MLCRLGFHFAWNTAETAHQKLPQIPPGTVRAKETEIMNMKITRKVRFADFFRINFVQPIILCKCFTHIIVQAVDGFLRIGIFVDFPVVVVQVFAKHVDGCPNQRIRLPS